MLGNDAGVVANALNVGTGFVVLINRGSGKAEDHVVVGLFEFGGAAAFEFEGEFEVDGKVAEFAFEADGFAMAQLFTAREAFNLRLQKSDCFLRGSEVGNFFAGQIGGPFLPTLRTFHTVDYALKTT